MGLGAEILDKCVNHMVAQRPSRSTIPAASPVRTRPCYLLTLLAPTETATKQPPTKT